jgi:hypothetical protein
MTLLYPNFTFRKPFSYLPVVHPLQVRSCRGPVMSQPVDSEVDESRTQSFGAKRTLATADGEDTSSSTPSKRSRRSRRGLQNHRDFVPMGGSFSNSRRIINAVGSDADNSSESSAISAHDPENNRTRYTDMEGNATGHVTTRPRLPGERPILGQNRLITGFTKTHSQSRSGTQGQTSEVSRNDSTSRNSIGESADDAIEISDDTDMENRSEDGGMMININDESEDGASNPEESLDPSLSHFRVTGWTQTQVGSQKDGGIRKLCSYLERRAAHFEKLHSYYKIIKSRRAGDALIISVLPEAAQRFAELDGAPFSHAKLTVSEVTNQSSPRNEISMSDGEIQESETQQQALTRRARRKKCRHCGEQGHKKSRCPLNPRNLQAAPISSTEIHEDDAHEQLQGSPSSKSTSTPITGAGPPPQRLGDLSSDEFEKQVKYTLFHLNRDQIDLNRPAICTTCLQEGHQEASCPESNCVHCGIRDEHPSRLCPEYSRCLKCRERGHDVDTCISKLKNLTVLCDHCGSDTHLEDTCPSRFFPVPSQGTATKLRLWISCCICASKTHLVGDCPERRTSSQATAWSLRSLNPMQISNLSLESGTQKIERDVEIRGERQEGLVIKGRADTYGQVQGNGVPSMRPLVRRQDDSPRRGGQNRFEDRDSERDRRVGDRRRDGQDDYYRPSSDSRTQGARYDRYEASYTDYRDQSNDRRDKFYATDSFGQRRRSRSPDFRNPRAAQRHDSFQPPLPKEPLPNRPPPPPSRQRPAASTPSKLPNRPANLQSQLVEDDGSHQRYGSKQEDKRRTKDQGPPGVDSYRPMPSAARQAWDKHRL